MATTVPLGTAATFGVLANTAVTNTGPTVVTGDLGVSPAGAVTGFGPGGGTVTGTIHVNDAAAAQAQTDLLAGYANALVQPVTATVPTELGGTTLPPGVYNSLSGTFSLNGTLTLDAQGNPNAVFIFKTNTTLITGATGNVNLINQAQSANVFWQVGSSATLGAGSTLRGSVLAFTSITATTGAIVDGRLLALGAAVTLDTNTITVPALSTCSVVVQPVAGPVVVGQPTPVTAVVTCNGLPVLGASVTFNGGAAPVPATTNAAGIATGTLTFNTAGPATVTATVTAAGTGCACTGVVSAPLPITVTPQTSPLSASPACWRVNLPFPIPSLFVATLTATLTPAQAGVTVTFYVSGLPVGTAVTNAAGVATLNAGLSILQISASTYTAVATVGGVTVQATNTLRPCFPPV
ncbi:ice-binding family protein [Streptomyces sioyaensis]|uniref:ice-binding family protein n=1 Tax=Streptomyces sioyaensis TaxID=67364 RepID=UPI0037A32448